MPLLKGYAATNPEDNKRFKQRDLIVVEGAIIAGAVRMFGLDTT